MQFHIAVYHSPWILTTVPIIHLSEGSRNKPVIIFQANLGSTNGWGRREGERG